MVALTFLFYYEPSIHSKIKDHDIPVVVFLFL